jgi:hypothetical protein
MQLNGCEVITHPNTLKIIFHILGLMWSVKILEYKEVLIWKEQKAYKCFYLIFGIY